MPPIAVLVALADPTRCRIIEILRDGAKPVHVLAGQFDISRPAISRHLRVLRQARLISEKKVGRENLYALHPGKLKPVRDWLETFAAAAKSPGKPASKPARDVPIVVAVIEPVIVAARPVPVAPPPASPKAVSQMGFDF